MSRSRRRRTPYTQLLADYKSHSSREAALLASYEYGRDELASGRGLIDVITTQHEALLASAFGDKLDADAAEMLAAAHELLVQSVVPFELASRGYADANRSLRSLNDTLEQRVAERTAQLKRRVEELKALGEISRAIASNLDLDAVLTAIVTRAVQLASADDGTIFQFDPLLGGLKYRASHGLRSGEARVLGAQSLLPIEDMSPISSVARSRESLQLIDHESIDQLLGSLSSNGALKPGRVSADPQTRRAMLILPLVRRDGLAGVLCMRRSQATEFSPDTVDLLETFATQSTAAIHNAELFIQLEQKTLALERADRLKSEFLASMSHELRTPLNAIIGFAEVLLDHSVNEIPEAQRTAFLEHIRRSGKHLLTLINNVLDLSRIEADRFELDLREVDLGELIDGCVSIMRVVADTKRIRLETSCQPAHAMIRADPDRLRQIVYNLLSNAVKFTPSGGRAMVRARVTGRQAVIEVRDSGIGMEPEDLPVIFDEFRQVGEQQQRHEGAGLGLSVARKLVALHGGKIWVTSTPGRGSVFRFSIPIDAGVLETSAHEYVYPSRA